MRELATVTRRSRFRQYFSIEEAEQLIADLWDLGLRVGDAEDVPAVTRDPDDDYLVALSRTSGADVLVSGDRGLLDLAMAEVEVLAPREFVDRLTTFFDFPVDHWKHLRTTSRRLSRAVRT